jgi:pyridoxine kinase
MGAAAYDCGSKETSYYFGKKIPGMYHGTGDVFSSVLLAGLMNGQSMGEALRLAVDFTAKAIQRTYEDKTDTRYGVNFEQGLITLAGISNPGNTNT